MTAKMQLQGHQQVWYLENCDGGHGAGVEPEAIARVEATAFTFLKSAVGANFFG
jgi:prolyl oligopeptidase